MGLVVYRSIITLFVYCTATCLLASADQTAANSHAAAQVEQFRMHPLAFTENCGQWPEDVFYRATAGGPALWFTQDGITHQFARKVNQTDSLDTPEQMMQLPKTEQLLVTARFVGANPDYTACGENLMEYKCNYFIGNDPSLWRTDVPNYQSMLLEGVYDGIDIRFYGNGESIEYDIIVAPSADPSQIQMEYDNINGLSIDDHGNLIVQTGWGTMSQSKPIVYQQTDGDLENIDGRFIITNNRTVSFEFTSGYDVEYALFIDPVLTYSTYLGGTNSDIPNDIAVDASGSAFITGETATLSFPILNPFDGTHNGFTDCFVTKFAPSGTSLLFSTFLGGAGDDIANALSLADDRTFVTGYTSSPDFPVINFIDPTINGGTDGFVSVLGPAGNTSSFSTFIGGESNDFAYDIAAICTPPCATATYQVWITGSTISTAFPVVNAYDATANGANEAFIVKYNLSTISNSVDYSTYFGGGGTDIANAIDIRNGTDPCITGQTSSFNLPLANPIDNTIAGPEDAFVTCFAVAGNGSIFPTFSTFLGGADDLSFFFERGTSILVRPNGNVCIVGETCSNGLGTAGAFDFSHNGNEDIFVAEYNPTTPAYVFGTYLGGSGSEIVSRPGNIVTDAFQNLYVCGQTSSTDLPLANPYDSSRSGSHDAFVAKISPNGSVLAFCSYLGGSDVETSPSIGSDSTGCLYAVGSTSSTNYPVVAPYDGSNGGLNDAFLTKICLPLYLCGDADGNGLISISDAVYLINYIFSGGPAPSPVLAGDVDCNALVTISDAVFLINYIFAGGPAPCASCP